MKELNDLSSKKIQEKGFSPAAWPQVGKCRHKWLSRWRTCKGCPHWLPEGGRRGRAHWRRETEEEEEQDCSPSSSSTRRISGFLQCHCCFKRLSFVVNGVETDAQWNQICIAVYITADFGGNNVKKFNSGHSSFPLSVPVACEREIFFLFFIYFICSAECRH